MASGYLHRLHIKSEVFNKINMSSGSRWRGGHQVLFPKQRQYLRRQEKSSLSIQISTVFLINDSDHKIFLPPRQLKNIPTIDCITILVPEQGGILFFFQVWFWVNPPYDTSDALKSKYTRYKKKKNEMTLFLYTFHEVLVPKCLNTQNLGLKVFKVFLNKAITDKKLIYLSY